MATPFRFGTLGAARITPAALVHPAAARSDVVIEVVAARSRERAEAYAAEHGIARVLDSYADVVTYPDIDAVYNPLPASLHHEWTMAALAAGKHVLCEKPMSLTAAEAAEMAGLAAEMDLVCAEAFHYRYHPLFKSVIEVVTSGELGALRRLEGQFTVHIPSTDPVRHELALGGGALMDLGCYVLHQFRSLAGEPTSVEVIEVAEGAPGVDVTFTAEIGFPGGVTGRLHTSMVEGTPFVSDLTVIGELGRLKTGNVMSPHGVAEIHVSTDGAERTWAVDTSLSTYAHQLSAFVDAARNASDMATAGQDPVLQMTAIELLYDAAGLPTRGSTG